MTIQEIQYMYSVKFKTIKRQRGFFECCFSVGCKRQAFRANTRERAEINAAKWVVDKLKVRHPLGVG